VTNIPPVPNDEKSKVEIVFADELKLIKSPAIKQFVVDVFEKLTPDYFWTVPCSTSGKYHPQYALGTGGLIRHVKSAVWWGIELSRSMQMEQYHDEMVAALLLHDLIKNGKGLNSQGFPLERGVTGTHGVTLAAKLSDDGYDSLMPDWKKTICDGIAGHMGIWTTDPAFRPKGPFENLIHLADYCASRKVDELITMLEKEKSNE
jgi:hypothetical protein